MCLVLLSGTAGFGSSASAATPTQVDDAITKATKFLYDAQQGDNWEVTPKRDPNGPKELLTSGQWGGPTAIAVYALLACGEDPKNPRLAGAINFLKTADMVGTYAIAMRCQVWAQLPRTPETRKLIVADRTRLEGAFNTMGKGASLYGYLIDKPTPDLIDHSVSQFGVLSMWACADMGIEIPTRYWSDVERRWTADQQPDGGWFYSNGPVPGMHTQEQASMTAAGVATLFLTQDYVHQSEGIRCVGNIKNEHITRGLQFLADHKDQWTPMDDLFGAVYPGYALYGIERVGVASGLKYLGAVDWYQYGSDWCVDHQHPDGSWNNVPDTALCMLFLTRGRAPLLINKVEYNTATGKTAGQPGPWNQRPRDVANFVHWMGTQTERYLNWQVTNLDVPEEELHDAPFLYFSGNRPLSLKPQEIDKLKRYIQRGGMLLFNSDCGEGISNPFVRSVIALGKQMFPDYEFRDLPESHPILTNEQYSPHRWKRKLEMLGLSNDVRELMIVLPSDPAKAWQLQETGGAGREECYQAVDDLILYGTDQQKLPPKGQSFLLRPDLAMKPTTTDTVVRLKYSGNWDPEPGGWDRLGIVMHNLARTDLKTQVFELSDQPIPACTITHLTGTTAFVPTHAQEQTLKAFVEKGGTLVIDCAGGSSAMADSMEAMLSKMFPDGLTVLPATDGVYAKGVPKGDIRYRRYARTMLGTVHSPQLKVIQIKGRNAIYYSRYDLSGGLVGEPIDGIVGYDPDSATHIVSGILLGH